MGQMEQKAHNPNTQRLMDQSRDRPRPDGAERERERDRERQRGRERQRDREGEGERERDREFRMASGADYRTERQPLTTKEKLLNFEFFYSAIQRVLYAAFNIWNR